MHTGHLTGEGIKDDGVQASHSSYETCQGGKERM